MTLSGVSISSCTAVRVTVPRLGPAVFSLNPNTRFALKLSAAAVAGGSGVSSTFQPNAGKRLPVIDAVTVVTPPSSAIEADDNCISIPTTLPLVSLSVITTSTLLADRPLYSVASVVSVWLSVTVSSTVLSSSRAVTVIVCGIFQLADVNVSEVVFSDTG